MSEHDGEQDTADLERTQRFFRRHATVYGLVVTVLVLIDLVVTDGWLFFWPVAAWSTVILLHYFYAKSMQVDSRWVDERIDHTLDKAYDIGHIQDISERYEGAKPHTRDRRGTED